MQNVLQTVSKWTHVYRWYTWVKLTMKLDHLVLAVLTRTVTLVTQKCQSRSPPGTWILIKEFIDGVITNNLL